MVAVGDHDMALREGGRDDLGDELPPRGHEQVHLRLGVYLETLVEQDVANLLAKLGASGLAHHDRIALGQPLTEQFGLRGLA